MIGVRFGGWHNSQPRAWIELMEHWFRIAHLDIERLLANWRWLCTDQQRLVARSAFGDLFLSDESGCISKLDVSIGKVTEIAHSEVEFRALLASPEYRNQWFAENDEVEFASRGLVPSDTHCIGFDVPLVFKQGGVRKPYLIDIYEHVSFLGDVNKQIADVPDGSKIKLMVVPPPLATDH